MTRTVVYMIDVEELRTNQLQSLCACQGMQFESKQTQIPRKIINKNLSLAVNTLKSVDKLDKLHSSSSIHPLFIFSYLVTNRNLGT